MIKVSKVRTQVEFGERMTNKYYENQNLFYGILKNMRIP